MITDKRENYPQVSKLKGYLAGGGFIAGGCFRGVFEGKEPKDIDIFFQNEDEFLKAWCFYEKKWKKVYENESAVGFYRKGCYRIDLVRSIFGRPEDVLNLFDFTVAKFAMTKEDVIFADTYWRDMYLKRLVCDNNIPKPIGTFNRAQKYASYGYFMCRETKLKLLKAIQAATVQDIETLNKSLYQGWD